MDQQLIDILKAEYNRLSQDYIVRDGIFLDLVAIGGKLQKLRINRRLAQKEVANDLDLCQAVVSAVENGNYKGRYFRIIAQLAHYYKVTIDNLIE